ncbi:MAG: DUF2442 domain-containing protein [Oculatellaceae cyanobacterium bins.114]|nr:DUF2442 domain-containing protein [Oculatellaceae cyanobacterium bins.114]
MVEPSLEDLAFQQQFEEAQSAATQANLTEPRAVSAYYDSTVGLVIIRLQSGAIFSFPPEIAQGLAGAEPDVLAQVEVTPMGDGLHWETLDADFSVAGLLAGVFGTKRWMADLQQRWLQQQAS